MDQGAPAVVKAEQDVVCDTFLRLRDRLLGTAYGVLGHREDAREAVQEAFLRCWRSKERALAARNLDAWVFRVVLNTAKDQRRRRRVRRTDTLPPEDAMPLAADPAPPDEAARREDVARLRVAIRGLPEAEREVFLLRQNGDLTFAAVAEALGAPVGTVKTRMRSALRRLRDVLDESRGARGPHIRRAAP